jgi:predicted aconitase
MQLSVQEQQWLSGAEGKAMQLAMQLMVAAADAVGATEFVDVEFAHINSCHYSGQLSLDFAEFLLAEGARLSVPTHTNASLIDCSTPLLRPEGSHPTEVAGARRLMEIYEELGCTSMWSCAPYQEPAGRPDFGSQIVGSESNAVSFYNSVLGARTNKYGDLLDISAAMTGRVPLAGLHTDEGRLATHVFELDSLDQATLDEPELHHLLGVILGQRAGSAIAAIDGLPTASEDQLKAIAAAGATAGAVGMFHVVGTTPEAPTLEAATGGRPPQLRTVVTDVMIADARAMLSTRITGPLRAVCLGTPHFSVSEFSDFMHVLDGRQIRRDVAVLVTTSRSVHHELQLLGWADLLGEAGVQIVLDTCTYYTPRATEITGLTMTNSAKWAYYAPGILDIEVAFGSLAACVESAVAGEVTL